MLRMLFLCRTRPFLFPDVFYPAAVQRYIPANASPAQSQVGILCLIPFSAFIAMTYTINNSADSVEIMPRIYGLPVAQREGHGPGTRSISAFCEKMEPSASLT